MRFGQSLQVSREIHQELPVAGEGFPDTGRNEVGRTGMSSSAQGWVNAAMIGSRKW